MKYFSAPAARRLLLLAILLGAFFFVQPVQQTVYAAACCSDCAAFDCSNCTDIICFRICYKQMEYCNAHCDPSC